jgi:hypothetical protein
MTSKLLDCLTSSATRVRWLTNCMNDWLVAETDWVTGSYCCTDGPHWREQGGGEGGGSVIRYWHHESLQCNRVRQKMSFYPSAKGLARGCVVSEATDAETCKIRGKMDWSSTQWWACTDVALLSQPGHETEFRFMYQHVWMPCCPQMKSWIRHHYYVIKYYFLKINLNIILLPKALATQFCDKHFARISSSPHARYGHSGSVCFWGWSWRLWNWQFTSTHPPSAARAQYACSCTQHIHATAMASWLIKHCDNFNFHFNIFAPSYTVVTSLHPKMLSSATAAMCGCKRKLTCPLACPLHVKLRLILRCLLFIVNRYMFRNNWPSSCIKVVVLKDSAVLLGMLSCWYRAIDVHMFGLSAVYNRLYYSRIQGSYLCLFCLWTHYFMGVFGLLILFDSVCGCLEYFSERKHTAGRSAIEDIHCRCFY